MVLADVDSATQALTILLDNAIKYSPKHETIILKSERLRRGMWAISVQDRGPGIPKDEQKRIFTRFYRVDSSRTSGESSGYGLGLEIAQMIAKRHSGAIELKSVPGKGSTFSLVLPSSREKSNKESPNLLKNDVYTTTKSKK